MDNSRDQQLDAQLRKALGCPDKADFDDWRERHQDAVAYLNPVVTKLYLRRRRLVMRIASGAIAAVLVLAVLTWTVVPEQQSFAQAVKALREADTITWRDTSYARFYSKDGKRTWLRIEHSTHAYKHPGLYRHTHYDDDGNVSRVKIFDSTSGEFLVLDIKGKKAGSPPRQASHDPRGPFGWVMDRLEDDTVEFVGQRNIEGKAVNVIRHHYVRQRTGERRSFDIWLDVDSKRLVGYSDPGADQYDFLNMPDQDNPNEKLFSKGTMLGGIVDDIVYNANLDSELFSLTAPAGFEIVEYAPPPAVTEAEMVEFLGVTARFNEGTFHETDRGFYNEEFNAANNKDKADRTEAEQRLIELYYRHRANDNRNPILDFAADKTVAGTFRYLGRGVKLGSADRIVCWYKLKSTGKYRGVFGDLTVKDVSEKDLPLPVAH